MTLSTLSLKAAPTHLRILKFRWNLDVAEDLITAYLRGRGYVNGLRTSARLLISLSKLIVNRCLESLPQLCLLVLTRPSM